MPGPLVLFDIDGTLLRRAGPHHREALVAAVRRATGIETTTEGVPVQGMLDRDIVAAMLESAGASQQIHPPSHAGNDRAGAGDLCAKLPGSAA